MITERSIQQVRDAINIVDVIGRFVDLKKRGSNYISLSPFTEERTPSFNVNPAKGIFKCFSSGNGGDAISFVMTLENMDFITAIRHIATWYNITLEENEAVEDKLAAEKRTSLQSINKAAANNWQQNLLDLKGWDNPVIVELLENRQLSNDSILLFKLGYAPDEWRFLTQLLVEKGLFNPASELGLTVSNNGSNYDVFRNRIMFPVHDERGNIIGFGGRKLEDGKKDNPKYINSKESELYKKERILYGLYQAGQHIRKMKFAILVEGYYDVISFHQAGMPNTVAPCGTALTEAQARLLKKYTDHVVLMGDGDKAGKKANLKAIDIFIKLGFHVEICPLPDGQDPDSFARTFERIEEAA